MKRWSLWLGLVVSTLGAGVAAAETAAALRAGTLGVGVDLSFGVTDTLNLRLGYSGFSYDDEIDDSDVHYEGDLTLSNALALADWHVFGGGFRVSAGAVAVGTKVDVTGEPTGGSFDLGDETFDADEVGSLTGKIEYSNSVAPYLGIGWGNTLDKDGRVSFLFDLGVIYGGDPEVSLNAICGTAAPVGSPACNDLQSAVEAEEDELEDDVSAGAWWPVLSFGVSVRF